ncbi:MAG: rhodanese-like domain-containing protein, partial [Parvibaculaceae bacterium]
MSPYVVSTDWLAAHLKAPDIAIIDASWYLPAANRNARTEFEAARIPGAQFFDIDDISESETTLPHMLPKPEKFASRMRKLGIGDGKRVIAYDGAGLFSAARAWWMFRVYGHDDVAVLDGGFPKWKAEGRPIG